MSLDSHPTVSVKSLCFRAVHPLQLFVHLFVGEDIFTTICHECLEQF